MAFEWGLEPQQSDAARPLGHLGSARAGLCAGQNVPEGRHALGHWQANC